MNDLCCLLGNRNAKFFCFLQLIFSIFLNIKDLQQLVAKNIFRAQIWVNLGVLDFNWLPIIQFKHLSDRCYWYLLLTSLEYLLLDERRVGNVSRKHNFVQFLSKTYIFDVSHFVAIEVQYALWSWRWASYIVEALISHTILITNNIFSIIMLRCIFNGWRLLRHWSLAFL